MNSALKKKQWIFLAIATALIIFGKITSPLSALTAEGNTALFFMLALVVIIASESLPAGLIGIIAIVFLPILGLVDSLADSAKLFGNQLFFYIMACYAIAAIMGKLPISRRILRFFVKRFGKTTRGTITAMLLTGCVLSTFVSNFPATLLILMIGKQYLGLIEDKDVRWRVGSPLMIGIIVSTAIGGIVTPVGSSSMALTSGFLIDAGYPVTFLQWMAFGVPIAVIWFPIFIFILFKILPPPEQDEATRAAFLAKIESSIPDKYSSQEIFTIIILCVTFICWVLNFNLMLVTCCCCIALLFPGFGLLSWEEFNKETGWSTIIMICSLTAVVSVLQATGVVDWLLLIFQSIIPANANTFVLLLIFGVFVSVIVILMPNGPALVTILGSTIIPLAASLGIHPAILLLGFAFFTTYIFIMPVESIALIVYEGGRNFKAMDMTKVGIPILIVGILITSAWLPICGRLLGFA